MSTFFLLLFLISLVDEVFSLLAPLTALSGVRNFLADVVIVMAVLVYLCLGIDKRLPKRVFLFLILFVFWCPMGTWFFPVLSGNRAYGLLVAAGQVLLCLLPVHHFRKTGERSIVAFPIFTLITWYKCIICPTRGGIT